MKNRFSLTALFLLLAAAPAAYSHNGGCTVAANGQIVCAPPNGGIQTSQSGQVVCGPGQCIYTSSGQIVCSSKPGGGAIVGPTGQALCVGGCVPATPSYCAVPR